VFHKFYPHAKVQKIPCGAEENYEFESNWWGAFLRDSGFVQRLRLDRDREASRDLNRLLDEPGGTHKGYANISSSLPRTEGLRRPEYF
jgi:hypothetical protein